MGGTSISSCFLSSPDDIFSLLLETEERRERGRGKRRERDQCVRETSIICLLYVPQSGIEPAAFWCTGPCSNQLRHTGQGSLSYADPMGLQSHMKGLGKMSQSDTLCKCSWETGIIFNFQETSGRFKMAFETALQPWDHPCKRNTDETEKSGMWLRRDLCLPLEGVGSPLREMLAMATLQNLML